MIQLSTLELNSLFLENTTDEPSCALSSEDQAFYDSIKTELNRETREPHGSTIERILAHSRKLSDF